MQYERLIISSIPDRFRVFTNKSFMPADFTDIFGEQNQLDPPVTFISLKMKIIELLLRALTVENEPNNTQMLLGM